MTSPLASRCFSLEDQIAFAKLSSDWNPMHLDQAFARRTQVGAPVVHGIHNLVWATDAVLRAFPIGIANIRARFLQPLYLDEPVSIHIKEWTDKRIEFEIVAAATVVAFVKLSSEPAKLAAKIVQPAVSAAAPMAMPADLGLEQLAGQVGAVSVPESDLRSLYPALAEAVGLSGVRRCSRCLRSSAWRVRDCTRCLPGSTSTSIRTTLGRPPWPTRYGKSMRDSDRCKSMFRAMAPRAGWTRFRAPPRRPNPAWPRYLRALAEAPLPGNDRL